MSEIHAGFVSTEVRSSAAPPNSNSSIPRHLLEEQLVTDEIVN